ncbi:MAG: AAA family ATPase [Actinobacteria bacterium]|nr:AAA family ATPase [Actinomycetota bacterium]
MTIENVISGLNPEQRRAVKAVRGPVCILAGAGSGKTTTITRRIANQVSTGTFRASEILAVTFTDKAAGEMRSRLAQLGATGVRARTFHSAALAQLHHLGAEPPGQILPTKGLALRQIANTLPKPYKFRPAGDLATEVEWARNRRLTPATYEGALGSHEPPIPADLMQRVFAAYENGKKQRGLIDFEDVLELTIHMFENDPDASERFHERYRAFTVDEYQDVNLLQQTLLDRWLGARDDLCVVGDDYQSIYAFTGASASYLLEMPKRFPRTTVVRLEENHRSTPQILAFANRLVPKLGGAKKTLLPVLPDGPEVVITPHVDPVAEANAVAAAIGFLKEEGVAFEDIAILYRTNFRSEDHEEALTAAGIPFQVRDGAFLSRAAARRVLSPLKNDRNTDVHDRVAKAVTKEGYVEDLPDGLGDREVTRQNDLARLLRLAAEFDDGFATGADFVADLHLRFGSDGAGRGVNLLTYHRAKGLEFEAVFLPRLNEGDLPYKRSKTDDAIAEERRLLYVGMTRAKRYLSLSWTTIKEDPSRFLDEMGLTASVRVRAGGAKRTAKDFAAEEWGPAAEALKRWRLQRSKDDGVPAYVVFNDATLEEIARRTPKSPAELVAVPGIGLTKLERYGEDILRTVAEVSATGA